MKINGVFYEIEALENYLVKIPTDEHMHGVTGVYAMCYMSMPQKLQFRARSPFALADG